MGNNIHDTRYYNYTIMTLVVLKYSNLDDEKVIVATTMLVI